MLLADNVYIKTNSIDSDLTNAELTQDGAIIMEEETPNTFSSFLGITVNKATESTSELSKMSSSIKNMLMAQQANRKKKRYTEDGRLCASAFAQDGQTFFDCTSLRSPDGQMKNQEWCYVDAGSRGDKPWDYCKPIMDYDKIREENQIQLMQFTIEARKVQTEIDANIIPGQAALDDLKKVRKGQAELDTKISILIKDVLTLSNNMQSLYNTKDQWEKVEEIATSIAAKTQIKFEKAKEEALQTAVLVKMDTSADNIKKESQNTKAIVSGLIQERTLSTTNDCNGMSGYEEDPIGNGLVGQYFDNESFLGDYKEQKDPNIDYDWTGSSPTKGINPNNFSVRWEGFIYAPITTNYQFSVECDDGATITINDELIVSHKMYTATAESKGRVDGWLKSEVIKITHPTKNFNKSTSLNTKLMGGNKFKIVVSYYHSVHNDVMDDEKAFVKLYWASDEFDEQIISKDYLYTQNSYSPLKISGFTPDIAIVRKLAENDLAFKNSDKYILQDIPIDFLGLSTMKLNTKYAASTLSFEVNIPVIVYIGRLAHYPNPAPGEYENTGEYMSLLQIEKPAQGSMTKKLDSKRSGLVKIYKKKYLEGKVNINLNTGGINGKGIPMIVFFGFDTQISSPISCGGTEFWISQPNSIHYKECHESTSFNANYRCTNGLNGRGKDMEGSTWATQREGIGSWVTVEFKELYQITKVYIINRRINSERNERINMLFSSASTQTITLKNNDEWQEFIIEPPMKSTNIKFLVESVYGTINNGGSFKVYGTKCIDPDNEDATPTPQADGLAKVAGINPKAMKPMFKSAERPPISLNCKDSLSNTKKLDHIKQKAGTKVIVRCNENCGNASSPVYGDIQYAKDSSICRAAYHSQKLKSKGGLVEIVFQAGTTGYKASTKNGIKSKPKTISELTLTFEAADEIDPIILNTGSKVDIKDPNGSKYLPGVISQIRENTEGKVIVVTIEGEESGGTPLEIAYPNTYKVKPCGDFVKDRACKGSRKTENTDRPINIKFAPGNYLTPGNYIIDKGDTFGKTGRPFGWSKDMTNRMRTRLNPSQPEMDSLVEFPPSPKSKFCNKPTPDVVCDKISWSIKTGHGKYTVKIYIGDQQSNSRVDLKVNDDFIVKGKTLEKGNMEVFEGSYESVNEYLTISSECVDDCEYAMSKMNMVEISQYVSDEGKEVEPTPEREDPCGNASVGGKCDKGPDVSHCVYDDPSAEGAKFCSGDLVMLQVPKQYRCINQVDKFKCVKRKYPNQQDCLEYCPGSCKDGMCL